MTWGSNRSSRIKICVSGLCASLLLMITPMILAYLEFGLTARAHATVDPPFDLNVALLAYSLLFVVGIFCAATFLGVLVSQLVAIEANAEGTAKLLGLEMPFEVRGATVLLLVLYLLVVLFILAFDLEEQWTVKSLQREIISLQEDLDRERIVLSAIKTIHNSPHIEEIPLLRLSYHCGGNAVTEAITEWSRLDPARRLADQEAREPTPIAFPVSTRNEFIYRVKYQADTQQDFDRSPIRVRASLDSDGALRAEIHMAAPEAYQELWSYCKGDEVFLLDDVQLLQENLDPTGQGVRP